jgi:hypothetical protein
MLGSLDTSAENHRLQDPAACHQEGLWHTPDWHSSCYTLQVLGSKTKTRHSTKDVQ